MLFVYKTQDDLSLSTGDLPFYKHIIVFFALKSV